MKTPSIPFFKLTVSTLFLSVCLAHAQTTAFTYQARLNDGASAADGSYDLQFAVFDTASGGAQQSGTWTQLATTVSNGLFTVSLDFGDVFPGTNRWLEIGVRTNSGGGGTFTTLSPRQHITATPYAIYAPRAGMASLAIDVAANAVGAGGLQSSSVNSEKIVDGSIAAADVNSASFSNTFWKVNGNAGADPINGAFFGTTDNLPVEFRVNGARALRLEPTTGSNTVNVIGGSAQNLVGPSVEAATIAGGGSELSPNTITASYATIGGGTSNTVAGSWSTIGGGTENDVKGDYSTVSGGAQNIIVANADAATIGGGDGNVIQSHTTWSTIAGGRLNLVRSNNFSATIAGGEKNAVNTNASFSSIGGGLLNSSASEYTTLGGGKTNTIQTNAIYATISGGSDNTIRSNSWRSTVGGGFANTIGAPEGTVSGGAFNNALGFSSTIGGGGGNAASGDWSTIAGGRDNWLTNASYATIGGGLQNIIQTNADFAAIGGGGGNTVQTSGHFATIPGGRLNSATNYAFAAGTRAKANHSGAFVWADSTDADFASTTANQFLIRAGGGVGINTTTTSGAALAVNGMVAATYFSGDGAYLTGVAQRNSGNEFIGDQTIYGQLKVSGNTSLGSAAVASGQATAAVGFDAQASGDYSTAIGSHTRASGNYTMATGFGSQANHSGSFVWADTSGFTGFSSTGDNQFLVRAAGGVGINKNNPASALDVNGTARIQGANNWGVSGNEGDFRVGNDSYRFKIGVANGGGGAGDIWMRAHGGIERVNLKAPGGTRILSNEAETSGVSLAANGTAWGVISDRNLKKDFAAVDSVEVLEKLAALPITQWHYNWESAETTPHIGPMAQDFKAAFYPGTDDKSITTQEADGVALAAIQGLNQKLEEELTRRNKENAELKQRLERLEQLMSANTRDSAGSR